MKKQKTKSKFLNLIPKPKDYSSYKLEDINNFLFDNNKKYLAYEWVEVTRCLLNNGE